MCPLRVHCFVSLLLQKLVNFPLTWFLTSPSEKYPYCPGFFHSPFHSSVHGPQGPQVKSLKFEIMYSSVSHLQCTALKNECFDFAATLECWILAVANWILLGPKLKQTKPYCEHVFSWLARVPSKNKIADPPSRNDISSFFFNKTENVYNATSKIIEQFVSKIPEDVEKGFETNQPAKKKCWLQLNGFAE